MKNIREAVSKDISRIAEIFVFNNRMNYWPIFRDTEYSFGELQVASLAEEYLSGKRKLDGIFVYDDGVVKGFVRVQSGEIKKLYVDHFFQNEGIGSALLSFAIEEQGASYLWTLEKNIRAVKFYQKHGFHITEEKMPEAGTTEYLIKLEK